MTQIDNAVLNMLQEISKVQSGSKPGKKDPAQGSSQFKDLMEQHQQEVDKGTTVNKQDAQPSEHPQQGANQKEQGKVTEDADLQNAILLAAMSMMSAPVIPVNSDVQTAQVSPQVEMMAAVQGMVGEEMAPAMAGNQMVEQPKLEMAQAKIPMAQNEGQQEIPQQAVTVETQQVPQMGQQFNLQQHTADENPLMQQKDDQSKAVEVEVMKPDEYTLFGEVETAPVKVGETFAPRTEEPIESVGKQVMDPITKALEKGESKVEIQLTPEHLGAVKVELTRREDGSLQVVLTAEKSKTMAMLEKHIHNLQTTLAGQNQEPVRVVVQQQDNQNHANDQFNQNEQGGHPQQQQQHRQQQSSQDFMQQLRLGLISLDPEAILEERK